MTYFVQYNESCRYGTYTALNTRDRPLKLTKMAYPECNINNRPDQIVQHNDALLIIMIFAPDRLVVS